MTLSIQDLERIEQHWAVQALPQGVRQRAAGMADLSLVHTSLGKTLHNSEEDEFDPSLIEQVAVSYELAAVEGLNALIHSSRDALNKELQGNARAGAYRAFGLLRSLPVPVDVEERIFHVLHLAGLSYISDRWTDLRRWLDDHSEETGAPTVADVGWDRRLLYRLYDCWLRLLRKKSWDSLDQIGEVILGLRRDQAEYEKQFINEGHESGRQSIAFRLIALYHLAKATERLAIYVLQGEPPAIETELDQHFEAAVKAAQAARDNRFEMILRWLHASSRQMVAASLWWVAHSVNSRVTKFVHHVTKHRALFELLPPQQAALREQGLLDQASRAVIVDMPTSGGKTQLAQFRILQALNQFSQDDGWVAYVAPTRALVSQVTRRLRSDFEPLGVHVEQLTGAIEVDTFEDALLGEKAAFQVLVATPEKLQLVLRNKKVARPLALLVLDEAHNIEDAERGMRIELLLATIKHESPRANFLLLMPFVPNAQDLAQWLAPERGRSISLGTTAWQPNDRLVGMFSIGRGPNRGDWNLQFQTLTTTQRTIHLRGVHGVDGNKPLQSLSYTRAKSNIAQAAAMAKAFSRRGTSIAVAGTIPNAWSMARKLSADLESDDAIPEDIQLVQRFLSAELGPEFELIDMLSKRIAVHHAGLPSEVLALVEWLTEQGYIRVLCATTTIAQGLNFPVASVFLATIKYPYGVQMSHREFWNLAGRAGRIGQGSMGVVGIASADDENAIRQYVSSATGTLISRMETLLDELYDAGRLLDLSALIMEDQWADYRSYIAHLWNEKRNLDMVIGEAEQTLRNTYGFGSLRSKVKDASAQEKADALLDATRGYVQALAEHPENASLADATGFSPEGVRTALLELNSLENKLVLDDWKPASLFGDGNDSVLPELMGVMMRIPQLRKGFDEITGDGIGFRKLADVTQAWVSGKSMAEIATTFFPGDDLTTKISKACKALYRDLANNGAWGLSALSKMPTAGINFDELSEGERRWLNNLPAMLYHGVRSEEAVLMRMHSVPRSVAEMAGAEFRSRLGEREAAESPKVAMDYLKSLSDHDWEGFAPQGSAMSGEDYRKVWRRLSGL